MKFINEHNVDEWIFNYLEGELSPADARALEDFIRQNPSWKAELEAWQATYVQEPAMEYPGAVRLTRPRGTMVPGFGKWGIGLLGAMAVLIGSAAVFLLLARQPDFPPGISGRGLHDLPAPPTPQAFPFAPLADANPPTSDTAPKSPLPAPPRPPISTPGTKSHTPPRIQPTPEPTQVPTTTTLNTLESRDSMEKARLEPTPPIPNEPPVSTSPVPAVAAHPPLDSVTPPAIPPSADPGIAPSTDPVTPPDFTSDDTPQKSVRPGRKKARKPRKQRKKLKAVPLNDDIF